MSAQSLFGVVLKNGIYTHPVVLDEEQEKLLQSFFKNMPGKVDYQKDKTYKQEEIPKQKSGYPKGFKYYHERDMCEDCDYFTLEGSGSSTQKVSVCTKVEPNVPVMLEDCCDEYKNES